MPLNDHNNIELVPTATKVPVPFVAAWTGGYQKVSDGAAAGHLRAKRSIGLRRCR